MKNLVAFLGASLLATAAFASHYSWDEFTSVKVSYNTGGYYTAAQAEAAADASVAALEAGLMPSSTMKVWGPSFCKDVNSADSHQAVSEYIQSRIEKLGAGWTRNDVQIFDVDFKSTRMSNGQQVFYAGITAVVPCVIKTASRRHDH